MVVYVLIRFVLEDLGFWWVGFGILWVLVWIGVGGFMFFGLDRWRRVAVTSRISHVDSSFTVIIQNACVATFSTKL